MQESYRRVAQAKCERNSTCNSSGLLVLCVVEVGRSVARESPSLAVTSSSAMPRIGVSVLLAISRNPESTIWTRTVTRLILIATGWWRHDDLASTSILATSDEAFWTVPRFRGHCEPGTVRIDRLWRQRLTSAQLSRSKISLLPIRLKKVVAS